MCVIQNHTCVCPYTDHPKLFLSRKIVCAPSVQCETRDNPTETEFFYCDDFHISREARRIPYHCAVCYATEYPDPPGERGRPAGKREHPPPLSPEEQERAFELMDKEKLTEFHHLDKQRGSGRTYFLQPSYRSGFIDLRDEYTAELYRTGNDFLKDRDENGELIPTPNGQTQGVEYPDDPTPRLYLANGEVDKVGEYKQARANESATDPKYKLGDDWGLHPPPANR